MNRSRIPENAPALVIMCRQPGIAFRAGDHKPAPVNRITRFGRVSSCELSTANILASAASYRCRGRHQPLSGVMRMSEQTGRQATLIPAEPPVLVLGDRRISIDEWPLAHSIEERRSVEVNRPSGDVLVIEPKKRTVAGVIVTGIFVFLGGTLPAVIAAAVQVPVWLSILIGLLVLSALLMLVRSQLSSWRWIRFDRQAGNLVIERKVGFRRQPRTDRTCPLQAIQAVQLLYSGRHSVTEQQGAGETTDGFFPGVLRVRVKSRSR